MTHGTFTPGDWQRNGNQIIAIHCDEDGEHETLIADIYDQHDWWQANARLIKAAPAMLAALEETTLLLDASSRNAERLGQRAFAAKLLTILSANRAAIAKATGGQP